MDATDRLPIRVRWMILRDVPEVVAIEAQSGDTPWSEQRIRDHMRTRRVIGMAAECGAAIVGYMIYEMRRGSIEVVRFAVDPDFRRCGVGSAMVAKLKSKLSRDRRRLAVSVRDDDLPAHLFFRASGFRAVNVLREHFTDGEGRFIDAYRFVHVLTDEPDDGMKWVKGRRIGAAEA